MEVTVEEAYSEFDQTIDSEGNVVRIEIPYIVFGAKDEDEALESARKTASDREVSGMILDRVEMDERKGETTWKVKAVFADDGTSTSEEDEGFFAFDTGGGTMHRNSSIQTRSKYPEEAPDFNGAIEVDNEGNVNGVDVTMPLFNFSETHTMKGSVVTAAYKKKVAELTGTVNASSFRGFDSGEVLFLGASGEKRSEKKDAPWEITFRFSVSPNQESLKVGDITVSKKFGWDYLWTRYADQVSSTGKNIVKKPTAVYIEQVYPAGDFDGLGI